MKQHHNVGKRHAAKSDDERKTSTLYIRVTKEQKTRFDKAAKKAALNGNFTLSNWVMSVLEREAKLLD